MNRLKSWFHGRFVVHVMSVAVVALCSSGIAAKSIEDVMIDPGALEPDCTAIEGEHAVSLQAVTHYATVEQRSLFGDPPDAKEYQSFDCGGTKSTIYYYQYRSKSDLKAAQPYTEGKIWGGDGPSRDHPELILTVDNLLVIISSPEPKFFKKHIGESGKKK